jgi:hypothetical protein
MIIDRKPPQQPTWLILALFMKHAKAELATFGPHAYYNLKRYAILPF